MINIKNIIRKINASYNWTGCLETASIRGKITHKPLEHTFPKISELNKFPTLINEIKTID